MMAANNPVTTIVIGIVALVLGLPVAIAAIAFERPYVRNIVLGSKTIDVGLGRTKTVSFDLLSGPNDAVTAAAFISIISAILVTIGLILIRHITRHNIWGWLAFGPALLNVLGQIGCCAAAYIFQSKYPVETLQKDLKYVNGAYDTNGTLFTKEAWACAMNNLYAAQEGDWANKACSNFKTGRMLTIPLVLCSLILLALAYWQVHLRGGFGWLFGRRDKVAAAYSSKGEYVDVQQ